MLECNLCGQEAWKGPRCSECPLYQKEHYTEGFGAKEGVDYFCVAESPHVAGPSMNLGGHASWSRDVERMVRDAFGEARNKLARYRQLVGRYTYSIRCGKDKPIKKELNACASLFHPELLACAKQDRPIMIFTLGPKVLQSLQLKVKKYSQVQGRLLEGELDGRRLLIYPSLSKRQIFQNPGHFEILKKHIQAFLGHVWDIHEKRSIKLTTPTELLIKRYKFPKTVAQVEKLVEYVINYAPEGKDPDRIPIAIDTETNTLFPHRKKLKILTLIVSWGPKLSASIPLEHPDTPYEFKDVAPFVQRLLDCEKPKIFHGAKYDLNVLRGKGWNVRNVAWCTLLGEHLLEESKKGYYGLKEITRLTVPSYGNYEDELQEYRNKLKAKHLEKNPLSPNTPKLKGIAKKLQEDDGFIDTPLKMLNQYGGVDGDVTRQIAIIQKERIEAENEEIAKKRRQATSNSYYRKILQGVAPTEDPLNAMMREQLIPACTVLGRMETEGIRVDRDYIQTLASAMDASLLKSRILLNQMIHPGTFSGDFNPDSTAHLRKLLFGTGYRHPETGEVVCYQGIIDPPKTPTGLPSTDAKFLRILATVYKCPLASELLKHRKLSKARNTFIENIKALSQEDGRMHTTYLLHGTSTGRTSSRNENMQNIPSKIKASKTEIHNIKKIFIPTDPETQVIFNADAKAAEVRVYAAYSKDENLIKALREGMDPHSFFASTVYNPREIDRDLLEVIGIDSVHDWSYSDFNNRGEIKETDEPYGQRLATLRKNIKRVVFGILYGASKYKISSIVGIPDEQAQAVINTLFKMFPSIPTYIQETKEQLNYMGVVENFFGRRRRFKDLKKMTGKMRSKAERQAVNYKIQSTSSEIVIRVLCAIADPIERDLGGRLMVTVHDSIVGEIPKKYISQLPDIIEKYGVKDVGNYYQWLPVPFKWDIEIGPSYGELVSINRYLSSHDIPSVTTLDDEDEYTQDILEELSEV